MKREREREREKERIGKKFPLLFFKLNIPEKLSICVVSGRPVK